jgi:hypothetical protein
MVPGKPVPIKISVTVMRIRTVDFTALSDSGCGQIRAQHLVRATQ